MEQRKNSSKLKATKVTEVVHKNVQKLKNEKKLDECERHGKKYLVEDHHTGELTCSRCGHVICDRMVVEDAEWRCFGDENISERWAKSRIGHAENPLLGDEGNLGTSIRFDDLKSINTTFGANIHKQVNRRSVDKALIHAFEEIRTTGYRIHLPESVLHRAQFVYCQIYRQLKYKGNMQFNDSKVPASIYIACRLEKCSRSTREIAAICEVRTRDLRTAIRKILKGLNLDLGTFDARHLIDRVVDNIELSPDEKKSLKQKARAIADKTMEKANSKRFYPETVVGGQILLAMQQSDSKPSKEFCEKIGSAVGLTPGTIIRSSKFLKDIPDF